MAGGLLMGALTSGALAAAVSTAPAADAICVSANGLTVGSGCSSADGSIAAAGPGATANSQGPFSAAVA